MPYVFFPPWQPMRQLGPVLVHYTWNNHTNTEFISQKNEKHRFFDKIVSILQYNLRSIALDVTELLWIIASWFWNITTNGDATGHR